MPNGLIFFAVITKLKGDGVKPMTPEQRKVNLEQYRQAYAAFQPEQYYHLTPKRLMSYSGR